MSACDHEPVSGHLAIGSFPDGHDRAHPLTMTHPAHAIDLAHLHAAWLEPTLRAGTAIMRHFKNPDCRIERKADGSPVTSADLEAEDVILGALSRALPGLPVVSEEAAAAAQSVRPCTSAFLLVDPLDGTREFAVHSREFTVNLSLIVDGRPVAGIIFAPALSELYATAAGGLRPDQTAVWAHVDPPSLGASCPSSADIPWRPLGVKGTTSSSGRRLLSSPREHDRVLSWLARTGLAPTGHAEIGSSLKFCRLARGDADLYPRFGPTSEWDTAAGQAILQATGGSVLSGPGAELSYGKFHTGLANPAFLALGPGVPSDRLWPLVT
ncbi:MAG: 3'(2'),5'-bisphosphate nucleotidase CysQ [Hyphomicrobiaceae bacterium]|nr:3'(2'),5'-bisphosphate nucleotidase CysQ [Hyphomicrobiaceae bacterium]